MQQNLCHPKVYGRFRKSLIGIYGPDIEILVSEFTTIESVRILISVPKQNQITKTNQPNLFQYIRKKIPIEMVHLLLRTPRNAQKCTSLLDLTKDYKKRINQ